MYTDVYNIHVQCVLYNHTLYMMYLYMYNVHTLCILSLTHSGSKWVSCEQCGKQLNCILADNTALVMEPSNS